jgi:cell division protein FtsZ
LVIINNNKLREVYGNLGFKAGFSKADEVLSTAARGIAEVITHHYTQNIDLKDAKTVLSNSGTAIMGSATASGSDRSEKAISKALDSPLLNDNKITGAKNVLLLIVSGTEEITIDEIGEINDFIQAESKSNVNIIMGVGEDDNLGEAIAVTVIATGFTKDQQHAISNIEEKVVIHTLGDEQKSIYDLSEDNNNVRTVKNPSTTLNEKPIENNRVVFDLGEEEEEFNIIPTTEFIKNIDVVHEEIAVPSTNDFVITDIVAAVEEPVEEEVEEKNQTALTFELPISEIKKGKQEIKVETTTNEVEVAITKEPTPIKEEEIHFSLEDFEELENNLSKATKQTKVTPKTEVEEEMNFTLHSNDIINEQEVIDPKEVSPLDLTISELEKTSVSRRKKMKNFNYKFTNKVNTNIDEFEREPAYKRLGVEIDNNTLHSSEINRSRTTLEEDENDDIQLRSNNSFLHDNVD